MEANSRSRIASLGALLLMVMSGCEGPLIPHDSLPPIVPPDAWVSSDSHTDEDVKKWCEKMECDVALAPSGELTCECPLTGVTGTASNGDDDGSGELDDPPDQEWDPWNPGPGDPSPHSQMEFEATLTCPLNTTRGDEGSCTFAVQPAEALDRVFFWSFEGETGTAATWESSSLTWKGRLVTSGIVTVSFMTVDGNPREVKAPLGVSARSDGIWSPSHWESQITIVEGQGGTHCGGSRVVMLGRLGWAESYRRRGMCQGQTIEGAYGAAPGGGPNDQIWYVSDVSFYVKSTTQLHPGAFPDSPAYPLEDAQQATWCGLQSGDAVNFWTFNKVCAQVSNWNSFIPAAWLHERQHFEQGAAVLSLPENNLYLRLEGRVAQTEFDLVTDITRYWGEVQTAFRDAVEPEPDGNWTIVPWWVWASQDENWFKPTDRTF